MFGSPSLLLSVVMLSPTGHALQPSSRLRVTSMQFDASVDASQRQLAWPSRLPVPGIRVRVRVRVRVRRPNP